MWPFDQLFAGRRARRAAADRLRDAVTAQARRPDFYTRGAAVDTFDGRFEIVAIHAALVMRRLREEGGPGRDLAQAFYERLFSGFDYALRETGVGDATIAKKVRGLGERFFGLARSLDGALAPGAGDAVEAVLARNGVGGEPGAFAAYVRTVVSALAAQPGRALLDGEVAWPEIPSDLGPARD